ncbi:MAG TPA: hypothetical protein VGF30_07410 [Bacteroidia bacterium]
MKQFFIFIFLIISLYFSHAQPAGVFVHLELWKGDERIALKKEELNIYSDNKQKTLQWSVSDTNTLDIMLSTKYKAGDIVEQEPISKKFTINYAGTECLVNYEKGFNPYLRYKLDIGSKSVEIISLPFYFHTIITIPNPDTVSFFHARILNAHSVISQLEVDVQGDSGTFFQYQASGYLMQKRNNVYASISGPETEVKQSTGSEKRFMILRPAFAYEKPFTSAINVSFNPGVYSNIPQKPVFEKHFADHELKIDFIKPGAPVFKAAGQNTNIHQLSIYPRQASAADSVFITITETFFTCNNRKLTGNYQVVNQNDSLFIDLELDYLKIQKKEDCNETGTQSLSYTWTLKLNPGKYFVRYKNRYHAKKAVQCILYRTETQPVVVDILSSRSR